MTARFIDLLGVVRRAVEKYASGIDLGAVTYPITDHERRTYSVVVVPDRPRPFPARVVVMARVVDNKVIIDEDTTDRPLWEELVRAGVPREQIICLYAGETVPEAQP